MNEVVVRPGVSWITSEHRFKRRDHLFSAGSWLTIGCPELPGVDVHQGLGVQRLNIDVLWELRGHSFHYSRLDTPLAPAFECVPYRYGKGEKVYRRGAVTASYLHAYFPSNPAAAAELLFPTA